MGRKGQALSSIHSLLFLLVVFLLFILVLVLASLHTYSLRFFFFFPRSSRIVPFATGMRAETFLCLLPPTSTRSLQRGGQQCWGWCWPTLAGSSLLLPALDVSQPAILTRFRLADALLSATMQGQRLANRAHAPSEEICRHSQQPCKSVDVSGCCSALTQKLFLLRQPETCWRALRLLSSTSLGAARSFTLVHRALTLC